MSVLLPLAALIFAAAITPGPNNYLILRAALAGGAAAAARAASGVIGGGVAMLLLAFAGVGQSAALGRCIGVVGGVWLAALALAQLRAAWRGDVSAESAAVAFGAWRMAAFQWLNPKAWVMVSSVAAAAATLPHDVSPVSPLVATIALFVATTSLCLMLWAAGGRAAAGWLREPRRRRAFEAAMGMLLFVSALSLALRAAGGAA